MAASQRTSCPWQYTSNLHLAVLKLLKSSLKQNGCYLAAPSGRTYPTQRGPVLELCVCFREDFVGRGGFMVGWVGFWGERGRWFVSEGLGWRDTLVCILSRAKRSLN